MSKNTLFRGGEDLGGGLEEHFFICWILKINSRLVHTDYGEASFFLANLKSAQTQAVYLLMD